MNKLCIDRFGFNPNRSLQHRFSYFILATCSPSACSRLPASCPSFFLDAARCACKKTTTNLPGQPTTISPGSNDRFGIISGTTATVGGTWIIYISGRELFICHHPPLTMIFYEPPSQHEQYIIPLATVSIRCPLHGRSNMMPHLCCIRSQPLAHRFHCR